MYILLECVFVASEELFLIVNLVNSVFTIIVVVSG